MHYTSAKVILDFHVQDNMRMITNVYLNYNSPFDVLSHEITDAPPKNTTLLAKNVIRPTRATTSPPCQFYLSFRPSRHLFSLDMYFRNY